jgi:integrase/recombinase XerD
MQTLAEAIASYLEHCRLTKNLSANTIKAYAQDLRQFRIRIEPEVRACDIGKESLKEFVDELISIGRKPATVVRKVASLRAFFGFLESEDLIPASPFRKLRFRFRQQVRLPKALDLGIVEKILSWARNELINNDFDRADQKPEGRRLIDKRLYSAQRLLILELLFSTGVRVGELCAISTGDVSPDRGVIKIDGKGGRQRLAIVTHPEVRKLLQDFGRMAHESDVHGEPFFRNRLGRRLSTASVRSMIRFVSIAASANTRVTPHAFRHTLATSLLDNGVDIRVVQEVLGHTHVTTTQIYAHVTENTQRTLVAARHPRNFMSFG